MSQADADKWDQRYREGAYARRRNPGVFLEQWLPRLRVNAERPRAVDLGCGAGRNALHLARHGWEVDAVDISQVALEQLAGKAREENLEIRCIQADLEGAGALAHALSISERYDLALIIRYTEISLIEQISSALKPGGYLLVELHLQTEEEVVGPRNPRFRVAPGAVTKAAEGLSIVACNESLVEDVDGQMAALSQLVARCE